MLDWLDAVSVGASLGGCGARACLPSCRCLKAPVGASPSCFEAWHWPVWMVPREHLWNAVCRRPGRCRSSRRTCSRRPPPRGWCRARRPARRCCGRTWCSSPPGCARCTAPTSRATGPRCRPARCVIERPPCRALPSPAMCPAPCAKCHGLKCPVDVHDRPRWVRARLICKQAW
jgi:hypothetical protein